MRRGFSTCGSASTTNVVQTVYWAASTSYTCTAVHVCTSFLCTRVHEYHVQQKTGCGGNTLPSPRSEGADQLLSYYRLHVWYDTQYASGDRCVHALMDARGICAVVCGEDGRGGGVGASFFCMPLSFCPFTSHPFRDRAPFPPCSEWVTFLMCWYYGISYVLLAAVNVYVSGTLLLYFQTWTELLFFLFRFCSSLFRSCPSITTS